ncbi:MAG: PilZ domain-containing protein [Termitinemataceae bacterium]|nr:MAG: PilZ domain-containing protein [Termitinemataceae bacterium]
MGSLPKQKIDAYYTQFKSIPVTFTKEIILVTGLQPKEVSIKCASDFFPCVIYSTNFEEAKVVANIKSGIVDKLKDTNNSASIKFSFVIPATSEHVAFLVPVHVGASMPYNNSPDMSTFTMQFSQRPPDDLIEIVGRIVEANLNATKRKDELVTISPESLRKLKFKKKDIEITVQGVPRRCILRDISFSGAHLIVLGVSKLLLDKAGSINFEFSDPEEAYEIKGKYVTATPVAERKDMVVLDLRYDGPTPLTYKVRLNDYIGTLRKTSNQATAPIHAPPPPPPAPPAPPAAPPAG